MKERNEGIRIEGSGCEEHRTSIGIRRITHVLVGRPILESSKNGRMV
jgi:hypothetical protein